MIKDENKAKVGSSINPKTTVLMEDLKVTWNKWYSGYERVGGLVTNKHRKMILKIYMLKHDHKKW